MKHYWKAGTAAAIAATLLVTLMPASLGVPAWARRTGMPCVSCHFGGTHRLTKMGNDFLLRGHRTKDDEGITDGGKDLNLLKYMSFASKVRFTANNSKPEATGFEVESFSIYLGGPLSGNFSFFVEQYLHERGKTASSTGGETDTAVRTKLADAYLSWSSAPQGDSFTYVRAGQIYPYAIYALSSGGRLSINRPTVINEGQGAGNLFTPRDRAYGVSAGYVNDPRGYRVEAGIVNSGGTNKRANLEEQNAFKDTFLTVEKEFDANGSALGLYAYNGRFKINASGSTPAWEDRFYRLGVFGRYQTEALALSGAFLNGTNQVLAGGHRSPEGYFMELGYSFQPTLTAYGRYDHQYNDLGPTSRRTDVTLGVSQRLSDVGRVVLEIVGTTVGGSPYKRQIQGEMSWLF